MQIADYQKKLACEYIYRLNFSQNKQQQQPTIEVGTMNGYNFFT